MLKRFPVRLAQDLLRRSLVIVLMACVVVQPLLVSLDRVHDLVAHGSVEAHEGPQAQEDDAADPAHALPHFDHCCAQAYAVTGLEWRPSVPRRGETQPPMAPPAFALDSSIDSPFRPPIAA